MWQILSSAAVEIGALRVNSVDMSRGMRLLTMWYVQPANAQISLRIRAV